MRKLVVLAVLLGSSVASAQVSTPPLRLQNDGVNVSGSLRYKLNFIGGGCVNNSSTKAWDCTLSGGGGGGVTSLIAGGGVTVSGATGAVTLGTTGLATLASPTFTGTVTTPAAITQAANTVETGGSSSTNTTAFTNTQNVANGASSTAFKLINSATLSTAGHSFLSLFNGGSAAGNEMFRLSMEATGFTISANPSTAGSFAGGNFNLRSNDSQWYIGAGAGIGSFRTGIYLGVNVASAIELWANGTNTAIATSAAFKPGVTGITLGAASLPWKGVVAGAAAASLPTCDATTRGTMFPVFAAGGASDTFQVCMKAAADTYAFRTVYTAP